jgi:membrane protease YdiL (CAAX protease family)
VTAQAWLLGLLVYPFLEELVFRAGLLRWADRRWPRWRGWRTNLGVSVVFGLTHAWVWPWPHALAVVLPSLALGWLMQRYGRLGLCVAMHSLFNLVGYAVRLWL